MEKAMEAVKSSQARTGLAKLVRQVVEMGQDALIEQNGEIVAKLAVKAPAGTVVRMKGICRNKAICYADGP